MGGNSQSTISSQFTFTYLEGPHNMQRKNLDDANPKQRTTTSRLSIRRSSRRIKVKDNLRGDLSERCCGGLKQHTTDVQKLFGVSNKTTGECPCPSSRAEQKKIVKVGWTEGKTGEKILYSADWNGGMNSNTDLNGDDCLECIEKGRNGRLKPTLSLQSILSDELKLADDSANIKLVFSCNENDIDNSKADQLNGQNKRTV
eukprot:gene14359-15854_t